MSAKDGRTELMPVVADADDAEALLPERVTEHTAHGDPVTESYAHESAPEGDGLIRVTLPADVQPPIPHPTEPFLDARLAPRFGDWAAKWVAAFAGPVENTITVPGSNPLMAKARRYARAQGRALPDTQALELGCWLEAAENLDLVEEAVLQSRPADLSACLQATMHALAALYVREHGVPR